jgi:hypothetical protein
VWNLGYYWISCGGVKTPTFPNVLILSAGSGSAGLKAPLTFALFSPTIEAVTGDQWAVTREATEQACWSELQADDFTSN